MGCWKSQQEELLRNGLLAANAVLEAALIEMRDVPKMRTPDCRVPRTGGRGGVKTQRQKE